jgi:hypothetical protein
MSISKDKYLDTVRAKLRGAEKALRHGPLGALGMIRDDMGIQFTFSNILNIAESFYEEKGGEDPVAQRIANFSGTGYADVSNVATVGAIDVTILTLANSLVPFLAVDRSMANPNDTIYYDQLVAVNTAGGVTAGDVVSPNFAPPNSNINLGPANAVLTSATGSGAAVTLNFNAYLVPGQVSVVVTPASGPAILGKDYSADGNIYFNGNVGGATVNYATGAVVFAGLLSGAVAVVTVLLDVAQDTTGGNILKIKQQLVSTALVTTPKYLIFEQDSHNTAYIKKILTNAKSVNQGGDYTSLHFSKVTDIYTEDINRNLLKVLVTLGGADPAPNLLSLSSYSVTGSFNATKDDLVHRFFINMRSAYLAKTDVAPTVCVCNTVGSAELESSPTKFIKSPSFYTMLNGVVGTYDGMPVFRHNYLDTIQTSTNGAPDATYYMATKLPNNMSGTLAFGEYLPFTQTGSVANYNSPIQSATGFFSQTGIATIQGTLIKKGRITYA